MWTMWPGALLPRPCLLGIILAMAAIWSGPASAGLDYGFEPEGRPALVGKASPPHELFRTKAISIPTNRFRARWDALLKPLAGRATVFDLCDDTKRAACNPATGRWLSYLSKIRQLPKKKQIALVNRYVNWHIRYADDRIAYGSRDYWASPLQSIGGRGDCEDYATAKYFSLISLGFSDDQVRLVIVRDDSIEELHALTTVTIGGEVYVLDNRSEEVLSEQQISTYRPIYSFSRSQNWMHVPG